MDETTSIVPIPLSSSSNQNDEEDEEESNQKTYNFGKPKKFFSDKNSRKTIFDDSELLNIISKEKNGRTKMRINKNTKINTNMTVTINLNRNNQDDDECDFPDSETKLNNLDQKNDKKGNYLFSLDNLKRNKILTKKDMDQNNINGASIDNINVIESKNNVNHVKNLFKKDIEEKNNNLVFDNHIMVPGVAEISELTGNFFFYLLLLFKYLGGGLIPLDKLMKVNFSFNHNFIHIF